VLDEEKCIGCRACILACPFGAIGFDYGKNIAKKCDLCGGDPKCVAFCETHALRYESSELAEMRKQNKIRDRFSGILVSEKPSVHLSK
jgi:Fe-S-cluster-containing hydrogenase component 2